MPLDLVVPVFVGEISPLARVSSMTFVCVTVSTPRSSIAPSRVDMSAVEGAGAGAGAEDLGSLGVLCGGLVLWVEELRPGALSITLGAGEELESLVIVLEVSLIPWVVSLSEMLVFERSFARESVAVSAVGAEVLISVLGSVSSAIDCCISLSGL